MIFLFSGTQRRRIASRSAKVLERLRGAVARARGVSLPGDIVDTVMAFSEGLTDMRSSLQKDLEAGKPLEIDSLAGAAGRLGREAGVPTPIHDVIYACLKAQDHGGPDPD